MAFLLECGRSLVFGGDLRAGVGERGVNATGSDLASSWSESDSRLCFQIHRACGVMGLKEESGMKKMIEFDNIIGGQDGGVAELVAKGNPFQLKVTRHDDGQYSLTVSRRNPDGKNTPSSTSG